MLKRQILKLLLDGSDTEPVRYRRINFQRFNRFVPLLLRGHRINSAHIVKAVCKLYNYYAYILTHRNEHFPEAFRLLLLLGGEIQSAYFGNAVNQQRNLVAELALYVINRGVGILHHIVQESRGY